MRALTLQAHETDTPPDLAGPDGADVPRDPQLPPGPDSKLIIAFPLEQGVGAKMQARLLVARLGRQNARLYAELQRDNHTHRNDGVAYVHRPEQWLYWQLVADNCETCTASAPLQGPVKVSA